MKTDYKYIRFEKVEDKPHHVEGGAANEPTGFTR